MLYAAQHTAWQTSLKQVGPRALGMQYASSSSICFVYQCYVHQDHSANHDDYLVCTTQLNKYCASNAFPEENVDIIVAEGGIQVVVPLLSIFQPDEPPNLREFVVNRSVCCAVSTQRHTATTS